IRKGRLLIAFRPGGGTVRANPASDGAAWRRRGERRRCERGGSQRRRRERGGRQRGGSQRGRRAALNRRLAARPMDRSPPIVRRGAFSRRPGFRFARQTPDHLLLVRILACDREPEPHVKTLGGVAVHHVERNRPAGLDAALELGADQRRTDSASAKAIDQMEMTQIQSVGKVDDLDEADNPPLHADDSRLLLSISLIKEGGEAVLVPSADLCEMLFRPFEIEGERKGIVTRFGRPQAKIGFPPLAHGRRRGASPVGFPPESFQYRVPRGRSFCYVA